MKLRRVLMAAGVVAATAFGFAASANAAIIAFVSGTIFWGPNTAASAVSGPNDIAHFGFDVNDQLPMACGPICPGSSVATGLTNFTYFLNNTLVANPATQIVFYDAAHSGLFDIDFNGAPIVSLYGPNIGNIGTTWQIAPPGFYLGTGAALNLGPSTGANAVVVTVTAVPVPAALPLFGAALAGLGVFGWRKSRKAA